MKLGQDPFEQIVALASKQSLDHIDLGLERVQDALKALEYPQLKLPPVIHVAGTNGKGSTCAFIAHLLKAHGLRIHRYTSPHLVSFEERILLAGSGERGDDSFVTRSLFEEAVDRIRRDASDVPLTPFEVMTVAAFLLFAQFPADVLILETGLGGLKDATNVISRPAVSVITSISLDHMDFLGTTVVKIATQKAGIIKWDCPVVFAPQRDLSVRELLEDVAIQNNSPFYAVNPLQKGVWTQKRLWVSPEGESYTIPPLSLAGEYQYENVGTALTTAWVFLKARSGLDPQCVEHALKATVWPARMQRIHSEDVSFSFDEIQTELWLDGGHNPDGAVRVCEALMDLEQKNPRPLHICFTLMKNRDPLAYLDPFLKQVWAGHPPMLWIMNTPPSASLWDGEALGNFLTEAGIPFKREEMLEDFVQTLESQTEGQPQRRILIGGSLYLAGAFLKAYHKPLKPWGF